MNSQKKKVRLNFIFINQASKLKRKSGCVQKMTEKGEPLLEYTELVADVFANDAEGYV